MTDYPFVLGHGTENDFVLLPDPDGSVHGQLSPARVRALCDRHAGLGGDGVIRVIRSAALGADSEAEWFMDYRNADGSDAEMCGNGIRVLARYLMDEGLISEGAQEITIGTRAGDKDVQLDVPWPAQMRQVSGGGLLRVDLGEPDLRGESKVSVDGRTWPAAYVDLGNPHAVVFVDDLAEAGHLIEEPTYDRAVYPNGVNVEFVVRRGEAEIAMRVHERGSGETRSCGTGVCAAMVATAIADGRGPGTEYVVEVPGGRLLVTWTDDNRVLLTGPAVLVASGRTEL